MAPIGVTSHPMKAVALSQHGGPEVLQTIELPDPKAGAGEVVVAVNAIGMNHVDLWVRRGMAHLKLDYPFLLGADVSGTIAALGAGVVGWQPGDPVIINPVWSCNACRFCLRGDRALCKDFLLMGEDRPGGYAEQMVVPVTQLVRRPTGLDAVSAAAVPVTFMTAWQMLTRKSGIHPGDNVVVVAAGSGVGVAAVQIAKLHGATVIASASSEEKRQRLLTLGADQVFDHRQAGWAKQVRSWTSGQGADVVFEHVGAKVFPEVIFATRRGGKIVTCGATSGPEISLDLRPLFFRQIELIGSTMGRTEDLVTVLDHIAQQRLKPIIDRTVPLWQAQAAHQVLEASEIFGKLVLTVDPA